MVISTQWARLLCAVALGLETACSGTSLSTAGPNARDAGLDSSADAQATYVDGGAYVVPEKDGATPDAWDAGPGLCSAIPATTVAGESCFPSVGYDDACSGACGVTSAFFYGCIDAGAPGTVRPKAGDCVRPPGAIGDEGVCCSLPFVRLTPMDGTCAAEAPAGPHAYACRRSADGGVGKPDPLCAALSFTFDWRSPSGERGPLCCCEPGHP